jgi:pimeloyl-ACP methyl ester carboxylesterase
MQHRTWCTRVVCVLAALALSAPNGIAHSQAPGPPAQPPAHWGPVSINLEDVEYPFPVKYLPLSLYGQDVRLAYLDETPASGWNGRTVVLLHGMNFFAEAYTGTIHELLANGFRVVAIDQIGFGRSSKPIIPYTLGDLALNIRTLLEHLGIDRAAVVAHSMGGIIATRFAFSYPEVASHLVLVNQIGLTDARLQRPWRRVEEAYAANMARDYPTIRNQFRNYYVNWDPDAERYIRIHYGWTQSADWPRLAMVRALVQQMIYAEPIVYDWPHIRVPTLVLSGAEDGPNFPALARNVAETIPGAELILIPNIGHNPHLEAPEIFHPALIRFLRSGPG